MGCDAPRTLQIAAKWSISSHRVAGPYTAKLPMISRYILRMNKVISNFMISIYFPRDISVKTWDLSIP